MKTRQHGAALVELALILPLLLLLTLITTEFGRAMHQYNSLTKSVRDAVRYLSLQAPGTHLTEARNLVIFGNLAGTGAPLALGLNLSHVPAPIWQAEGTNPIINTVTIRVVNYTFQPLLLSAFGVNFANGNIPFGQISATMRAPI